MEALLCDPTGSVPSHRRTTHAAGFSPMAVLNAVSGQDHPLTGPLLSILTADTKFPLSDSTSQCLHLLVAG